MNKPFDLVIVTGSNEASGALRLLEAATLAGYNACTTLVDDPESIERINTAKAVIFRVAPRTFATYNALLGSLHPRPQRELAAVLNAFDKIKTNEVLTAHALPTPASRTIHRNDRVTSYPIVIKIANGNQGIGVSLLGSDSDLASFLNEFSDETFLLQEYIKASKGTDKRLFVVGDRVVAAMRRRSQTDDFRANLHLGGSVEVYAPTEAEKRYAVAAVAAFGLHYAGVDIIEDTRGPLILEVNSSPGFGIQSVSDVPIIDRVVDEYMKAYEVSIRTAKEADIEEMFAISSAAHQKGYGAFIPPERRKDFTSRFAANQSNGAMFHKRARSRINHPDWRVLIAEIDTKIVGYAYVQSINGGYVYIRGIFVTPEWQGKGVGGALLEEVLQSVTKGAVRLTVLKENERARSLYVSRGFVEITQHQDAFFGAEQVVMELYKK